MDSSRTTPTRDRIILIAAFVLVLITVSQVLLNDLVWDDPFLIAGFNGAHPTQGLLDTLRSPFWDNSSYYGSQLTNFWRPLTSLLLWTGGTLFGEWTPGYHLLSILASLLATGALAILLRRLFPSGDARKTVPWIALVFLAHPLNAEVLCMVANLSDHLAFAFLLIQVTLFVDIASGRATRYHLPLAGLVGLLACASKELGVLSIASPMAAWLLIRSTGVERHPMLCRPLVWSAAVLPVAAYMLGRTLVMASVVRENPLLGETAFSPQVLFLGWGLAIERAVVPLPRGAHSFVADGETVRWIVATAAWLGLLAIATMATIRTRLRSLPAVGIVFALALVIPSLLAVKISDGALRFPTRYFHLPLAGLLIAAIPTVQRSWSRGARMVLPAAILLLCLLSWTRIAEWRTNVSFFAAETEYWPNSVTNHLNLAQAQCKAHAFDDAQITIDQTQGLKGWDDPVALALTHNALAKVAFLRDKDIEKASSHMQQALTAQPNNLDNVLALTELRRKARHPEQAMIILKKALAAEWFDERGKQRIRAEIERLTKLERSPENSGEQ